MKDSLLKLLTQLGAGNDGTAERALEIALALDFILKEGGDKDGNWNGLWRNPFNTGERPKNPPKSLPNILNDVQEFIKKLQNVCDKDQKCLRNFVWRFLFVAHPEVMRGTAFPMYNHSIYDLLSLSLAIGKILEEKKTPAFLLFTLGPVQRFISSARKTSDLWAGSYLLSYLTWSAVQPVVENWGPEHVIFPSLLNQPLMDRWLLEKWEGNGILKEEIGNKTLEEILRDSTSPEHITIANMPNRFFAVVPYEEAKGLNGEWEKKVKDTLIDVGERVLGKLICKDKSIPFECGVREALMKHLLNHFQTFWVLVPWWSNGKDEKDIEPIISDYEVLLRLREEPSTSSDNSEDISILNTVKAVRSNWGASVGFAYPLLYDITERFLAARKGVRDFEDVKSTDQHKCSLCGEYDPLPLNWENLSKWVSVNMENGNVVSVERLCGVCMTKRVFPNVAKDLLGLEKEPKYPSTSEVAATLYKANIPNETALEIGEKIKSFFDNKNVPVGTSSCVPKLREHTLCNIDGQWLMRESYRADYIRSEYRREIDQRELDKIWEELWENYLKSMGSPPTYYAILMMDGDHMGKWLSGENLDAIEDFLPDDLKDQLRKGGKYDRILHGKHPMTPALHNLFSRLLGTFALERVRCRVENNYGALVYAGGDDVLALLPARTAVKAAREIRESFKGVLSEKADMSAGLVFVHRKYPLSLALDEARDAEKKAKGDYGRGALYIKFIKRSGEPREFGLKWSEVLEFENLVCDFSMDRIPSKFGYEVGGVLNELMIFEEHKENSRDERRERLEKELKMHVFKGEVLRILKRKGKINDEVEKRVKMFMKKFVEDKPYSKNIHHFPNLLIGARFIASESGA